MEEARADQLIILLWGLWYHKNDKISTTDLKPHAIKQGIMKPFHGSNLLIMQFGMKTKHKLTTISYQN